jgi:hypothetical protein
VRTETCFAVSLLQIAELDRILGGHAAGTCGLRKGETTIALANSPHF